MCLRLLTALLVLVAPAAPATAPCPDAEAWRLEGGSLARGVACGTLLLASDAANAQYAFGQVSWREPVRLPYEVSLTWQRLSGDVGHSMGVHVLGGVLLFKDGHFGPYFGGEAAFRWTPLPGYRSSHPHTVTVRQWASRLDVLVDGRPLASLPVRAPGPEGNVGVGFKSPPGFRGRIRVSGFRVTSLRQSQ